MFTKKTKRHEIFKSFTESKGRFFSIFSLMMLGAFALVGLKVVKPDVDETGARYFKQHNMFDIAIIADYGISKADQIELNALDNEASIEYGYFTDVTVKDTTNPYRLFSMPRNISTLSIVDGQLPSSPNDIVLGSHLHHTYTIGDLITFSDEANDTSILRQLTFKVVGFVNTTELLSSSSLGVASAGSGALSGYGFITTEAFDSDVYTIARIRYTPLKNIDPYSNDYQQQLKTYQEKLDAVLKDNGDIRLAELQATAYDNIADGESKIEDAESQIESAEEQLESGQNEIDEKRAELESAEQEIAHNEVTLTDGAKQIAAAETQLANAKAELDNGYAQLSNGQATLDAQSSKIKDGQQQLDEGKKQLDSAKTTLDESKAQLDLLKEALDTMTQQKKQIVDGIPQIEEQIDQLKQQLSQIEQMTSVLFRERPLLASSNNQVLPPSTFTTMAEETTHTRLTEQQESMLSTTQPSPNTTAQPKSEQPVDETAEVTAQPQTEQPSDETTDATAQPLPEQSSDETNPEVLRQTLLAQISNLETKLHEMENNLVLLNTELTKQQAVYDTGMQEYRTGKSTYDAQIAMYEQNLTTFQTQKKQYDEAVTTLNAEWATYQNGLANYQQGVDELTTQKQTYLDGVEQLNEAKATLKDGQTKLHDAQKELTNEQTRFEKEKKDAQHNIHQAKLDIEDAKEIVKGLTRPHYTTYSRRTLLGSDGFRTITTSADGIDAVGNLFPVVLYGVAALLTSTTMVRFVNDERTKAGVFKALGYSNTDIIKKFAIYGLTAGGLGTIVGILGGTYFLPWILFKTLFANMTFPAIPLKFYWSYALLAIGVSLLCSVLPAILIANKELKENAAQLLLPKPPAKGSSILLEKITFIWKKLTFTQKVTARNIFRYKQRMLMTIFGVAGSVALLFAGLGITASLGNIATRQYGDIIHYDLIVSLNHHLSETESDELTHALNSANIVSSLPVYIESIDVTLPNSQDKQDISIMATNQPNFSPYIDLYDVKTGEPISLTDHNIAISEKLAALWNVKVGDTITLTLNHQLVTFKIGHIVELYAGHFIWMTQQAYESASQRQFESNGYMVKLATGQDVTSIASDFMALNSVKGVAQNESVIDQVNTIVNSLSTSMQILTAVSILLAIVILYNLTNINVSERIRELSTIKVLGFLNKEVTLYIYRETILLSAIGILFGLLGGKLLHRMMLLMVAPDNILFYPKVPLYIYVIPIVVIVGILTALGFWVNRHLQKVDMLEALKSVE